eukprot:scaffold557_cov75-Cyclotella_meneghiniana.AAC.9
MGLKTLLFGDAETGYDYSALCMPTSPWQKKRTPTTFYPLNEPLPLLLSLVMGLQHAFAMVGGLITPPFVIAKFAIDGFPFTNVELQQYMICASLITSINSMKANGISGEDAYGKMLGTSMACAVLEMLLSVLPGKVLRKIFPPVVTAVTVTLIGVALVGTGMKYWGGGTVCAEMIWKEHSQVVDSVGFGMPVSNVPSAICTGSGQVALPYGSPEYIGLGFSVLCFLVVIELFGSTFMKNCNVLLALLFGYLIAGLSNYEGLPYVDSSKISDAPWVDFLWTQWFGIGIYGPAVFPMLLAYIVTTIETIGDVTATHEVSGLETSGKEYSRRIQGALLSDSVCSMLASLCTAMPNTSFSQNNGIIAMTQCAARRAGFATAFWLIFMGVFSKISGIITSIPDCVIGGMTIFLFANVLVSGITLFSTLDMKSRRIRFISAVSLCVGVGVTVWPFAFQDMRGSSYTAAFWTCADCSETMKGVRDGVSIFLSTGYCIGSTIAIILCLILPDDPTTFNKYVEEETDIDWSNVGKKSELFGEEDKAEVQKATHEEEILRQESVADEA